jgi:hypothetical protein
MARKTATTTTTTKQTTTETRRVKSLTPKQGRQLSSLEEAVVRMHHGVSVRAEAALQSNAVTDELAVELLDREVDAHIATGRAEELPDVPGDERKNGKKPVGNQKSQKLIASLKKS